MDVNVQGFRKAALAYFSNLPQTKKYEIDQLFRAADTNSDGRISFTNIQQFYEFRGAASSSSTSNDAVKRF